MTATETITPEVLIMPTYKTLDIPNTPNYKGGVRSNVNGFGTVELKDFKGSTTDLVKTIGADFKAVRTPAYYMNPSTNKYEAVKNNSFLVNDKTGKVIGANISDSYGIFDFGDAIGYFMAMINEIKRRGYDATPAYGQVFGDGAKMFLQYHITSGKVLGEPVDTYLTLMTSHDKSASFTIALSTIRAFCKNQIHRVLDKATNKIVLRHSAGNKNRIETEAARILAAEQEYRIELNKYLEHLSTVKLGEEQVYNAFAMLENVRAMDTQRKLDNFKYKAEQLLACYRSADLNDWRGTALGGYYAYSDYMDHVIPTRKTNDLSYISNGFDGNINLGNYAKILTSLA